MDTEYIFNEWKKDSVYDEANLDKESLKTPSLHHKYYMMYISEKHKLSNLETELKILSHEKKEFYEQGHTEETKKLGWKLPPKGMILKSESLRYVEADPDIISLSKKIGRQSEKVGFLNNILNYLNKNRGWDIKNAIDFKKFQMGV